jgi:hypothetical protein
MSIAFIGSNVTSNLAGAVAATTLSVDVPEGVVDGDLLITCAYGAVAATQSLTTNAAFSLTLTAQESTNQKSYVFHRIASSEPSSYTWTMSSTGIWGVGCFAYRGVDRTTPFQASAGNTYTTTSPATGPSATATGTCVVCTFRGDRGSTTTELTHTSPDSDTERGDWGWDGGASTRHGSFYESAVLGSGSQARRITTATGSLTDGAMFTLVLNPANFPNPTGRMVSM